MRLEGLTYKDIIEDFSLETSTKKLAILGPSGCGKTTLLRLIMGLEVYEGKVNIGSFSPCFQEPRLIPWLSVEENLSVVIGDGAEKWLKLVGLYEDKDKKPGQLSGGMAQRLNLARALAYPGDFLILDEPFAGIDIARKTELKALIRKRNFILVTHDLADALELGEEILLVEGPPLKIKKHYRTTEGIEKELHSLLKKEDGITA